MKQFSIILILLSCVLGTLSHITNFIELYFGGLETLTSFSTIYVRFGELTFIIGFIGLYLTAQTNAKIKYLSLWFVLFGFFHFLIIEFGFINNLDGLSLLILLGRLTILTLFVLQFKSGEMDALRIKGFILISTIGIFWMASMIISFLPICEVCATPHATDTVLPFFYIIFQLGIWVFFLELYREIYHYKNEHYMEL
ncbi:MAG: hypothetical protein KKG64_03470 [Firmicutes bacterium]|nr:hypothetical protein [Bacillota bacterium]